MKRYAITFLIVTTITANAQKLDGFFKYYNLTYSMRLAFDDFLANNAYKFSSIFIMDINSTDTTKIVFIDGGFSEFLTNPPYYFSCYRNKILLVYTGKEEYYFPSKLDMRHMFDFITGVVNTCDFEIVSWDDYTFRFKPDAHVKACDEADDKLIYLYDTSKDSISKKPRKDLNVRAYNQLKFIPKIVR